MNPKDKVIAITGASTGIGRELALQLARQGNRVALAARRPVLLEDLKKEIEHLGGKALAVPTDVSKRNEIVAFVQKIQNEWGRLDIFISNAGITHPPRPLLELDESSVRQVMETNFMAAIYAVWAAAPVMEKQGGGQLVFVSSIVGKRGVAKNAVYCASKFALQGLTESIRMELKPKKIRVLTVCPPGVDTPFFEVNHRSAERRYRLHPVQKIARMIIQAIDRGRREVLLTEDAKIMHWLNVFFPGFLDWAVAYVKRSE
ncbi:MAG: SDR family oxidoreductase [Elusimicrobia bacterium]|nr:SDR family oxidoreductase [Candidatus Obscuribacterium magneticum]